MSAALSVVILTKDEETNIRGCLEGVKWADEIIVVDDMSSDATVSICREYTDKVFIRKLDGFGAQKQFGIDKASGEWILILDADETLSADLRDDLKRVIAAPASVDGYKIWRKTFYLGKWIEHCGWYNQNVRLFRRGRGAMDMKCVHESVLVEGSTGELKGALLHNSYTTIGQHVDKMLLYTGYEAKMLHEKGVRVEGLGGYLSLTVRPLVAFFRKYLLMQGYRDGMRGLLISTFTGLGVFLSYSKLWELQSSGVKDPKRI
jgi:glycosyltransferase involved in cell wall biosynthesis